MKEPTEAEFNAIVALYEKQGRRAGAIATRAGLNVDDMLKLALVLFKDIGKSASGAVKAHDDHDCSVVEIANFVLDEMPGASAFVFTLLRLAESGVFDLARVTVKGKAARKGAVH